MPYLSPADRERLLGPRAACPSCHAIRIEHYCRSCDVFFSNCACTAREGGTDHERDGHRLYIWTPMGVRAIPNFDLSEATITLARGNGRCVRCDATRDEARTRPCIWPAQSHGFITGEDDEL